MSRNWQAAEARNSFTSLVDGAVGGEPQFVKRRDGREVVVVSREYFEKTKPTFKDFLLNGGFMEDDEADEFDRVMAEIRAEGSPFILPGIADDAG